MRDWSGDATKIFKGKTVDKIRYTAEDELESKFNIREFHEIVLGQGTVTLAILEERNNEYIENTKNGS